jgi:hypothetical protein
MMVERLGNLFELEIIDGHTPNVILKEISIYGAWLIG